MEHDERAEAARTVYLGAGADEVVPWGGLKSPIQDRWRAVVECCDETHECVVAMCPLCCRAHDAAALRVPFSAAQIEAMARAFYESRWGDGEWEPEHELVKDRNRAAIRAALAAGGLEPCAVPNAAFPISSTIERNMQLEKECERLTDRLARVSAKSARRRTALRQLNGAFAVMHATVNLAIKEKQTPCVVPERASDEELGEVLRRELGMEGLPRPVGAAAAVRARVEAPLLAEIERLTQATAAMQAERASDEELATIGHEANTNFVVHEDAVRAVRARVEVPLLAEIERIQNHLNMAARAESDRTAERDTLKARVAELEEERDNAPRQPIDPDAWETPLEIAAPNKNRIKIHGDEDAFSIENTAYMVNTTVGVVLSPAAAASLARWAASYANTHGCPVSLARVLHEAPDNFGRTWSYDDVGESVHKQRRSESRTAFAHIGKTTRSNAEMQICINRKNRRIDALKACVKKWKAKATAATDNEIRVVGNGQPVTITQDGVRRVPETAVIASAETLEKLAEIAERAADMGFEADGDGLYANWPDVVTAILRAAKARVDAKDFAHAVSLHEDYENSSSPEYLTKKHGQVGADYLNSRIVYGVQLPEERTEISDELFKAQSALRRAGGRVTCK